MVRASAYVRMRIHVLRRVRAHVYARGAACLVRGTSAFVA